MIQPRHCHVVAREQIAIELHDFYQALSERHGIKLQSSITVEYQTLFGFSTCLSIFIG